MREIISLSWLSFSAKDNRMAKARCYLRSKTVGFGVKSHGLPSRGGEGDRFAIPSPNDFILIYREPPGLHCCMGLGLCKNLWRQQCNAPSGLRITHGLIDDAAQIGFPCQTGTESHRTAPPQPLIDSSRGLALSQRLDKLKTPLIKKANIFKQRRNTLIRYGHGLSPRYS